jgi:predicted O-methyltransferase YrrM
MTEDTHSPFPDFYKLIEEATRAMGFDMASDVRTCSLLRTLATTKPGGKFLELGTGTGLSTAWIMDGMDSESSLISVDHDDQLLEIAIKYLGEDHRLSLVSKDAGDWIASHMDQKYDFIFADTWHGKYLMVEEIIGMLNKGGFYFIDDMQPQKNWPEGHQGKAEKLIQWLDKREDLFITKLNWSTGIIVAVKK